MTPTPAYPAALLEPLRRDLRVTLGAAMPKGEVTAAGELQREFADSAADYVERVVASVQQTVHDLHLDTTWPACPRHRHHPLWYRAGAWRCDQDAVVVAPLGALPETSAL